MRDLRWAIGATVGLAVAVAAPLFWLSVTTGDNPDLSRPAAPSSSTTSTTVDQPSTTTTTTLLAADPIDIAELPGEHTTVLATDQGILVADPDGQLPLRRLTREPALVAFGVGPRRVVGQEAHGEGTGRIVVIDDLAVHEVFPAVEMHGGERHFQLHDAGLVGGRPVAVISSAFAQQGLGDEDDPRLVLLDLETLRQTDLGAAAGWEERVRGVRLLTDGDVVLHRFGTGGESLERRRRDGSIEWSVELPDDGSTVLATSPSGADAPPYAVLVRPRDEEDHDRPDLEVRRFALGDGSELDAVPVALQALPDGGSLRWPCGRVEASRTSLVCDDGSSGQILRISLTDGTTTGLFDFPDPGGAGSFATTWRR